MHPKLWKYLFAALNAFLMLIFAFYLLSLPYVHGDDMLIIEYGAKIKNILLGLERKPPEIVLFLSMLLTIDNFPTNWIPMAL
jgi:hypothetical protein